MFPSSTDPLLRPLILALIPTGRLGHNKQTVLNSGLPCDGRYKETDPQLNWQPSRREIKGIDRLSRKAQTPSRFLFNHRDSFLNKESTFITRFTQTTAILPALSPQPDLYARFGPKISIPDRNLGNLEKLIMARQRSSASSSAQIETMVNWEKANGATRRWTRGRRLCREGTRPHDAPAVSRPERWLQPVFSCRRT
jgi:hypothetical protein